MPSTGTDWKKEARSFQSRKPVSTGKPLPEIVYWDDLGKEVFKKGTRHSVGNEPGKGPVDIDHFLSMLSINMKDRIKDAKKPRPPGIDIRTRKQKMKGLFGGGR